MRGASLTPSTYTCAPHQWDCPSPSPVRTSFILTIIDCDRQFFGGSSKSLVKRKTVTEVDLSNDEWDSNKVDMWEGGESSSVTSRSAGGPALHARDR